MIPTISLDPTPDLGFFSQELQVSWDGHELPRSREVTQGGGAGEPSQDAKRERSREPGKGGEANGWPDEAESARVDFVGSGFSLTGESELASERARRPNASATVVVRTQASWRQRNPDYFIARRIDERDATQAPSPLRVPAPLSKLPWDLAQDQFSGCKVLILLGVMGKLLLEHAQDQYKVYLVDFAGDPSRVPLAERKDQSKSVST